MRIHREGFSTIGFLLLIATGLSWVAWHFIEYKWINWTVSIFACLGVLFVVRFFRKPNRPAVSDEESWICPADGLVVSVEEVFESEFFKANRLRVAIFMSGLDVHINWSPLSGEIIYQRYLAGKHLLAKNPKSSESNERSVLVIQPTAGSPVMVKQIAGVMARRVVSYTKPGEHVLQGEEIGFIKLGSRVEVYLPLTAKMLVQAGQKVVGKVTVLAKKA